MPENGVSEKGAGLEQYNGQFCDCSGLAEVKSRVSEMDRCAQELDEYASILTDEKERDGLFMHALRERMGTLYRAMQDYDDAVLVATADGYLTAGAPTSSGEVEFVPIKEAARRARTSRWGKFCNWFWSWFGYEAEPLQNDGIYCSKCSKRLPGIQYRDWSFESF